MRKVPSLTLKRKMRNPDLWAALRRPGRFGAENRLRFTNSDAQEVAMSDLRAHRPQTAFGKSRRISYDEWPYVGTRCVKLGLTSLAVFALIRMPAMIPYLRQDPGRSNLTAAGPVAVGAHHSGIRVVPARISLLPRFRRFSFTASRATHHRGKAWMLNPLNVHLL